MLEASFLYKLPVGIEHTSMVKPLSQVDTDELSVRESIHGRLLVQRVRCFIGPCTGARGATPHRMSITHKFAGTHVHPGRSKRRVKFGVAGESLSGNEPGHRATMASKAGG